MPGGRAWGWVLGWGLVAGGCVTAPAQKESEEMPLVMIVPATPSPLRAAQAEPIRVLTYEELEIPFPDRAAESGMGGSGEATEPGGEVDGGR